MSSCTIVTTEMMLFQFGLLSISLLSPRVLNLFLIKLRGAPKIDLPLSKFSLAKAVLTSLFSNSTLLAGETKTVVLVEATLGEEKSCPKLVQLEADF